MSDDGRRDIFQVSCLFVVVLLFVVLLVVLGVEI